MNNSCLIDDNSCERIIQFESNILCDNKTTVDLG